MFVVSLIIYLFNFFLVSNRRCHQCLQIVERSSFKGLFTWMWGTPGGWGNIWRSLHLTCKRDHIKMRDCMDRRVTSPTRGPPPPCKQALIDLFSFVCEHRLPLCSRVQPCRPYLQVARNSKICENMEKSRNLLALEDSGFRAGQKGTQQNLRFM